RHRTDEPTTGRGNAHGSWLHRAICLGKSVRSFCGPNDLVDWELIVFGEARVGDGLVPVNVAGESLAGEIEGQRAAAAVSIVPIDVGGLEVVVAKTREVSVKRRIERDLGRVRVDVVELSGVSAAGEMKNDLGEAGDREASGQGVA